jgi:hypothetical protein
MDILSKILNYESSVFEEYKHKRTMLLEHMKTINTSKLSRQQLEIFIHDIKSIIEPVKTSILEIDYYFTNTDLKKNDNLQQFKDISRLAHLLILGLYSRSESLETLEMEMSVEESVSEPESVSESPLV